MKEIEYTFMVTTYNYEKIVVECLESIKYQIINYAHGKTIQLILCDDASQDRTCKVMDAWVHKNLELFARVDKCYHIKNEGTCKNYVDGIRKIKGKKYREISGDDLLPTNNIFEVMDLTETYDIVPAMSLAFIDGNIVKGTYRTYIDVIMQGMYSFRQHRFLSKVICNIMNGNLVSMRLMSEDVLRYIEKYKLIEDQPQWYYIFKNNGKLNLYFSRKPTLLYRKSVNSVTGANSRYRKICAKDLEMLRADARSEMHSAWMKWCMNAIENQNIMNPLLWYIRGCKLLHLREIKKIYKEYVLALAQENEIHLANMRRKNLDFLRELEQNEYKI